MNDAQWERIYKAIYDVLDAEAAQFQLEFKALEAKFDEDNYQDIDWQGWRDGVNEWEGALKRRVITIKVDLLIDELGLRLTRNEDELVKIVESAKKTLAYAQYLQGNQKALNVVIGAVLKEHKVDPKVIRDLLEEKP